MMIASGTLPPCWSCTTSTKCSESRGVPRTTFAANLLASGGIEAVNPGPLEAAGVAPDAILADYLRSNDAVGQLRESILATMRTREGMTDEVVSFAESRLTDEVLGVREQYLASARRVLDETHGGLAGYLVAAGVTDDDVSRLRGRLLG